MIDFKLNYSSREKKTIAIGGKESENAIRIISEDDLFLGPAELKGSPVGEMLCTGWVGPDRGRGVDPSRCIVRR